MSIKLIEVTAFGRSNKHVVNDDNFEDVWGAIKDTLSLLEGTGDVIIEMYDEDGNKVLEAEFDTIIQVIV